MITYLVTGTIDDKQVRFIINRLNNDLANENLVSQIFFYAEAVTVGSLAHYSEQMLELIEIVDDNNISLSICSAGFQTRQLQRSEITKQDFGFKGLGQFIAESQHAVIMRLFPQLAASESICNLLSKNNPPNFEILISLDDSCQQTNIKEYLDIALVSSAYDISVAVYISSGLMQQLHSQENIVLQQAFNMMGEFNIPLHSDSDEVDLFEKKIEKIDWEVLQLHSRHHYNFKD